MTESSTTAGAITAPDVTVHLLRPAPPVRAFLIAAVLSVLGAVVLVASSRNGWPLVVLVLGGVLAAAGVALLAVAVATMVRMRVRAELTPTGYSFRTPAGVRQGTWAETVKVTASDTGHRLSFVHRDESVDHVMTPLGHDDPEMGELVADLTRRLEASRRG
ncbi:hypothetical protein [Mariniluteicoccus flavus]